MTVLPRIKVSAYAFFYKYICTLALIIINHNSYINEIMYRILDLFPFFCFYERQHCDEASSG